MSTVASDSVPTRISATAAQPAPKRYPAVLVDARARLDEGMLADRIDQLADRLSGAGVGRGHRVGIALRRRFDAIVTILACRRLDAAYVPLDPDFPAARLAVMLNAARLALLVVDGNACSEWCSDVPMFQFSSTAPLADNAVAIAATAERSDEELAYVLFTSGSTGVPKGVVMRAAAVDHLIQWHVEHPRLGQAARSLQFAPLGFDVSYQEIFVTAATAGTLVVPTDAERRDPFALLDLLARERVERLYLPYVGLQALAEAVAAGGTFPTQLRDVITAGEQLRITPALRALFTALPDAVLHNQYGPTETHVVTGFELSGDPSAWPELPSIGRPLPHVCVAVVDENLVDVASADEGELLLGGDCLAAGYANAPDLTAERFIERDGARWYRTGDRVRCDADGNLQYLGRLDQQIKLDGFRVEPAEIENVLGRHPDIAEAVVLVIPSGGNGQLVAHVVARAGRSDETRLVDGLRQHAAAHLASYLLPHQYHVHAALPLTASGKIDRRALARQVEEQALAWPDDASLEEQMTQMWQQLLDVAPIATHDNLFDHGARSLTVVRALTHLRKHGQVLSAAQIYDRPTIAGQLALLGGHEPRDASVTAAGQRGDQQRQAFNRFAKAGAKP